MKPHHQSISTVVLLGILSSQLVLLLFGAFLAFYYVPKILKDNYLKEFDVIIAQTRWAIAKSVSYSDYLPAEEYFKTLSGLSNIKAAFLLDNEQQCLAFSNGTDTGCSFFSSNRLDQYQNSEDFIYKTADFFHTMVGGKQHLQARLFLVSDIRFLRSLQNKFIFYTTVALAVLLLLSSYIAHRKFRIFRSEILSIRSRVKGLARRHDSPPVPPLFFSESKEIDKTINEVGEKITELQHELLKKERDAALGEIATQVAHDIQSPLTALDTVTNICVDLPEQVRTLIRSVIDRIRDVANDLNKRKEDTMDSQKAEVSQREAVLLSSLVSRVLSEKRMQFKERTDLQIRDTFEPSCYGLFSKIDPKTFKRVISNLVNNAVEAMPKGGLIEVGLSKNDNKPPDKDKIRITIRDNGKGIPKDVLSQLGERGFTYNKEGGSGLGLYQARKALESWNGNLSIDSEVGQGTCVTLVLPRTAPASWFVPSLQVSQGMDAIVLDDDQSVHQTWDYRFKQELNGVNLNIRHYRSAKSFKVDCSQLEHNGSSLFLMDYELAGEQENGLDLIESLGIAKKSILVTNRYEEKPLQQRCAKLSVGIIPKELVGYVPISITET